jgi:DNA-binding transcriptional regulator YhcF (GntR family)
MDTRFIRIRTGTNDHTPLYVQIEDQIKKLITEQGLLVPGTKIPAVHKLARGLGVSVTTVQKALGNLAREGLVYGKPGCGTYVSSPKAVQVRKIGVTCFGLGNTIPLSPDRSPTFFSLVSGFSEAILGRGFHAYLLARSGDVISADDIDGLSLSGIAFLSRIPSVDLVRSLKKTGFPYICVGAEPTMIAEDFNRVIGHTYEAMQRLIQELFDRRGDAGYVCVHTKVPLVTRTTQEIYRALRQARGQAPESNTLTLDDAPAAEREVLAWLKQNPHIRNLFVDDYSFALRVCHALVASGRPVPTEVFIASLAERHNIIQALPVAVAVLDSQRMGRVAGEKLIALIEGTEGPTVAMDFPACVHSDFRSV